MASASGTRNGAGTGHLHQTLFNSGAHHAGMTHANNAFHSASAGHNFNNGFNHNFNGNRNFNSQWSGGWNRWGNRSFFFGLGTPFGAFGRGYYPWYGYGYRYRPGLFGFYPYYGYGYGGYGYGNGYGYGYPYYGYNSYLYGYGYPYSNYGYGYGSGYPGGYSTYYAAAGPNGAAYDTTLAAGNNPPATPPAPSPTADDTLTPAADQAAPRSVDDITAADFAGQGEIDFKAGKYEAAARNFRHALVDDPMNAGVLMLLGQALVAVGQYDEAAGATATAMQALPQDKWGAVVENRQQLYGNAADFDNQLRALEKARNARPESPALHFLLGFQYGYSGNRAAAVTELDKTVQLEPKDAMAKTLRDLMAGKPTTSTQPAPARRLCLRIHEGDSRACRGSDRHSSTMGRRVHGVF